MGKIRELSMKTELKVHTIKVKDVDDDDVVYLTTARYTVED